MMNGHAEGAGAGVVATLSPDPGVAAAAAAAAAASPQIQQLNVTQKSRMHIGPKFVSVTQNVHNVEVVKGRALGLELQANASEPPKRRLRCSVAVCVCWALLVAVALTVVLLCLLLIQHPSLIDLDITEEWYLRRGDWQAMPAYQTNYHELPVRYALIGHSATEWCDERYRCIAQVLQIQRDHQRLGWADIGPNFLVSGNGLVFEGRGANLVGAMVKGWNTRSVLIMFLGNYRTDTPATVQLDHVATLLEALVAARILATDYQLLGHCQVKPYVYAPGQRLLDELHFFPHWNNVNRSRCLN